MYYIEQILSTLSRQIEQHTDEILPFANFVNRHLEPGANIIELGVRHGGTSELWCRMFGQSRIVGVDRIGHDSYQEPEFTQRAEAMQQQFPNYRFVRGNSQTIETRDAVLNQLTGPIGFIFIDADHSYEGVRRDFELWSPLVEVGGIVAFHDIVDGPRTGGGVAQFWAGLNGLGPRTEFLATPASDWGGIGALVMEQ